MQRRRIMVVAGEPSGDGLAARMVEQAKALAPPGRLRTEFFGLGGPRMAAAGVELLEDTTRLAIFGHLDALRRLPRLRGIFRRTLREAARRTPDAVVLVDYGGFNLRLARALRTGRRRGEFLNWDPRILYYVPPQVWASRPGRARILEAHVDRLISILPFEREWYARRHPALAVDYVGDPLAESLGPLRAAVPRPLESPPRIALLPGSRPREIERHLPPMLRALALLREQGPCRAALATPREELLEGRREAIPRDVEILFGGAAQALRGSSVALACSGTVVRECAWLGVPAVVVYRLSWLEHQVARRIVRVPYIAMPNILAGEPVYPELIQDRATPEAMAARARELLEPRRHRQVQERLARLSDSLGGAGASRRAAQAVLASLDS